MAGILQVAATLDVDQTLLDTPPDDWERDIRKALGKSVKKIGSGSFATVYQHPTDRNKVVKVVRRKDWCWGRFIELISDTTDRRQRKYLPIIHDWTSDGVDEYGDDEGAGVYIMERLYPWSDAGIKKAARLDRVPFLYLMHLEGRSDGRYELDYGAILKALGVEWDDEPDFMDGLEDALDDAKEHPFLEMIEELRPRCRLDLSEDNIMFRKNGQLVLNDPVADGRA